MRAAKTKKKSATKKKPATRKAQSKPAPAKKKSARKAVAARSGAPALSPAAAKAKARDVLATLRKLGSQRVLDDMANRYDIPTRNALGVAMRDMQAIAKRLVREQGGRSRELAEALWTTGCYEARTVAAFVDEPERVTPAQMDRWARGFDSWAICDTVCFHLFDRTPHALANVDRWAKKREEFVKRAAFALLACVALHDKTMAEGEFAKRLPLIEAAASDERNFVKKSVSWALRSIGRRGGRLRTAAQTTARSLAASDDPTERWVGKDALRDLGK